MTVGGSGDPATKEGICIYQYSCNHSMENVAFSNSDGEMLIVPQTGELRVMTECGLLTVAPKSILVIPRGIKFSVFVDGQCRGWICEVFKGRYKLPDLGPIGANGLANPRDFEAPSAWYEDSDDEYTVKSAASNVLDLQQVHGKDVLLLYGSLPL